MTVFYLAHHGQSECNKLGKIQGQTTMPLPDHGRIHAHLLGVLLVEVSPTRNVEIVANYFLGRVN